MTIDPQTLRNAVSSMAEAFRCKINRTTGNAETVEPPPRTAWGSFPDVVLLADELVVKRHPEYPGAKAGDARAAAIFVDDLIDDTGTAAVQMLLAEVSENGKPVLVSVHTYEHEGVNAIPAALATLLSERLTTDLGVTVVQTNVVFHTGADGYGRLARQARFSGQVESNREHVMVDDFVGQGGTLANLRGWIEKQGGKVVGAVALTGKPYSARLQPSQEQLGELRQRHGKDLERWWRERFGHSFDCLTQSEARYLARSPDVDTIRDRLAAAQFEGNRGSHTPNPHKEKRHVEELNTFDSDRHTP